MTLYFSTQANYREWNLGGDDPNTIPGTMTGLAVGAYLRDISVEPGEDGWLYVLTTSVARTFEWAMLRGGAEPPPSPVLVVGEAGATTVYRGGSRIADIETVNSDRVLAVFVTQHDVTVTPLNVQLPSAATIGDVHVIQDLTGDATANPIVVTEEGGGLINGDASYSLDLDWAGRAFRKVSATDWVSPQ